MFFHLDRIYLSYQQNTTPKSYSGLRRVVESSHESKEVQALMILSWAPKTQSSYNTYIKRWVAYFKSNKILDPYTATYQEGVSFFAHLFNKEGQKYGAMAVARSALSAILPTIGGKTFGQEPNVSQMRNFQGETITSQAKYVTAYDPDIILRYIDSLPHDTFLLSELLIKKLCTLLCLLRCVVLAGHKII